MLGVAKSPPLPFSPGRRGSRFGSFLRRFPGLSLEQPFPAVEAGSARAGRRLPQRAGLGQGPGVAARCAAHRWQQGGRGAAGAAAAAAATAALQG